MEPFASLVNSVRYNVPRVLFNRELVGPFSERRKRPWDVACAGDLTESVCKLVDLIGWTEELELLMKRAHTEDSAEVSSPAVNGTNGPDQRQDGRTS